MPTSTPSAVFTFKTPRQVLVAEDVLRRAQIDMAEVPPPSGVEADCDVAVRIPLNALYKALGAMATDNAEWQAVYQLSDRQEVIAKLG